MEELRAALLAFLTAGSPSDDGWKRLLTRLRCALDGVDASPQELDALAAEFTAEAIRTNQTNLLTPLYPFGVVGWITARRDRVRYESLEQPTACNCELVARESLTGQLDSRAFVMVASSNDDIFDTYEDFECPSCHTLWRHQDASTEQYTSWSWHRLGPQR